MDDVPIHEVVISVHSSGLLANHSMPCPVCRLNKAILNMNSGRFGVCDECHQHGWRLRKMRWFEFWLGSDA